MIKSIDVALGVLRSAVPLAPAIILVASSGLAHAATGADIVANGVGAAPACSACHGAQGEGQPDGGFPRLAGLAPGYIVQQLQSFADGMRQNDTMAPVAKALSDSDRQAVADYLSRQTPPKAETSTPPDAKLVAAGAAIATGGDWSKGLPGCNQCHGPAGQGVGSTFPRLAGQSAGYIESQIQAWKDGTRKNDPLSLMQGIVAKLDDGEIKAVAAYYASLDPLHPTDTAQVQGGSK